MKLYLFKEEYKKEFVISTIPHERMDVPRGWGNMPKVVTVVRLNEYGHRDETAPYRLVRAGPFELNSYIVDSDLIETSWLEILVTTGFTKAMIMEFLKKGKHVHGFHITDTL